MPVKNILGDILKECGHSQIWLAEQCNVSRATISNIIKSRYVPSIELAFKIADALNLTVIDIFYYEK